VAVLTMDRQRAMAAGRPVGQEMVKLPAHGELWDKHARAATNERTKLRLW